MRPHDEIEELAYGRSLPQRFYTEPGVFADDLRFLGRTQWLLADHGSRIPNPGDYFLFCFGAESLILVRDHGHVVQGYYNVCRHRGSRICLKPAGRATTLVCPYHAWAYGLDGRLRAAPAMGAGFDKASHGLRRFHVRECEGFLFVNLAQDTPPDFETFIARLVPYLAPYEFGAARVAMRAVYTTAANWKLTVENFLECYHCKPAHPTYCSVHDADKLLAYGAGPGSASPELAAKFAGELQRWEDLARSKGFITGLFADGWESSHFQSASRMPVGGGYATESIGGLPVAPLLGRYTEYDFAQSALTFNPVSHVIASSDHAIAFRFTPLGADSTDIEALWLVRAEAVEGRDYDLESLIKVWDVTLREVKIITENNQAGVRSSAYVAGPHSDHERRISDFIAWYGAQRRQTAPAPG